MNSKYALFLTLTAITVTVACKKESSDEGSTLSPQPTPTQANFRSLFADNVADATQVFSLNAAVGGTLIASQGTQLIFEPDAFRHANGTPVSGAVNVSVIEALDLGDMIWLNKQTVGNDNGTLRMLRSGGALNVFATQGSELLRITQSGLVAKIPTTSADPAMALFSGTEDADGNMIWEPIDSASVTVDPGYYTAPTYTFPYYFTYSINPTNLNWINCDHFWYYPSTTIVTATIPTGQSSDSTVVWIGFPSENAVMNMYRAGPQAFTNNQVAPVGMQAVIVGLQQTTTGYASSFNTITITSNMTVPLTFSPTTLEQFEAELDAL